MPARKVVILLSGGLDSNTALAMLLAEPIEVTERVYALIFDYGQSSQREVASAKALCEAWRVMYAVEKLDLGSNTDTRNELPARNLIFISHAARVALSIGYDTIAIGAEPDSTYTDSSVEFLKQAHALLSQFGLSLIAPVKSLTNKCELVEKALDLGVPLHLCHSSRSNQVDGACKTSRLFLDSLHQILPQHFAPERILRYLSMLRCYPYSYNSSRLWYQWNENTEFSFKFAAALFTYATAPSLAVAPQIPFPVYTTGSWGVAMGHFSLELGGGFVTPVQTQMLQMLMHQHFNCDSQAAQWGIKQALSLLPRARYAKEVACRVTQGHLARALSSLGYKVATPSYAKGLIIETA